MTHLCNFSISMLILPMDSSLILKALWVVDFLVWPQDCLLVDSANSWGPFGYGIDFQCKLKTDIQMSCLHVASALSLETLKVNKSRDVFGKPHCQAAKS